MDRRTVLKTVGVGALSTVSGCSGVSFGGGSQTPVWEASIGPVDTVGSYGGLVVVAGPYRPGAVTALDPGRGRVEWRCDRCSDYSVGNGWLYAESRRGGTSTVEAYSGPYTREWTVGGEFEAVRGGSVLVWQNRRVSPGEYRGWLRVLDAGTGFQQWQYGFDHVLTGVATTHVGGELFAVVTNGVAFAVEVHRLDPRTGTREWREQVAPGVLPRSLYDGETLFVGTERSEASNDASVTAVTRSGDRLWRQRWPGYRAVPEWVGEETVVVSTTPFTAASPTVRGLDRGDGSVRWVQEDPLVAIQGSKGYWYVDGAVVVRRLSSGVETGRVDLTEHVETVSPRLTGRVVGETLVVGTGQTVAAVDVDTGALHWQYRAGAPVRVVGVEAGLVLVSVEGTLVALPFDRP